MDLRELLEEHEELKKTPDVLADAPIRENTVGGRSADAQKNIEKWLPDPEKEYKTAEELTLMFDTSRRAGAGGTRSNVVGIRPHGGRAASAFLEQYTETGKFKKQAEPFEEKQKFEGSKKGKDVKGPSVVLYKLCMDCMQPVNRDECVPQMLPLPPGNLMNEIEKQRWYNVGIHPGDILCWLYCLKCMKSAMKEAQRLNSTGLMLVQNGQPVTAGQRYMNERGQRISQQVYEHIRAERQNPETDIFYGEAKNRV